MGMQVDTQRIEGLAVCAVTGTLGLAEIKRYATAMLRCAGDKGLHLLWDLRLARFDLSAVDVRDLAASLRTLAEGTAPRSAFVVAEDLEFGLVRMFQAYRDTDGSRIGVFRELDAAVTWLGEGPHSG